jgi:hypothetical protein
MLPIHIIDTIMSFNGREFYWNKYTKETRIRFIRNQFENKLSYLFRSIQTLDGCNKNVYYIVCRRAFRFVLIINSSSNRRGVKIVIKANKVTGTYFNRKMICVDIIHLSETHFIL